MLDAVHVQVWLALMASTSPSSGSSSPARRRLSCVRRGAEDAEAAANSYGPRRWKAKAKAVTARKAPKLESLEQGDLVKGELFALRKVINAPGWWHFMISYCQHSRTGPKIAINLAHQLKALGYRVWLDVEQSKKDVAAMREAVENSMMFLCILSSERPGDEYAYFNRAFCRKECRWAAQNEARTGGRWSKINQSSMRRMRGRRP